MLNLSSRQRPSASTRALAVMLALVTVGGGLFGALPVASARAATSGPDARFRHGHLDIPSSTFVPPIADAGDDQSVPEGNIVTLDATRSKSSNLVTRTYTTSADFAEGTSINLTDTPPDQLRLDDTTEAFGFIWIAASNRGTVVKIDTATGEVLGEYWSAPQNRAKDPSRTTVDHNGNVWVGNRAEASQVGGVVKGSTTHIGLFENGQCVDRNGNGVIDTSTGLGDIKAWPNANGADNDGGVDTATDECIINYVRTHGVAIRQVSVDAENHVWVGGAALGGSPTFLDRLTPDGTIVRTINMFSPADTGETGVVRCCYGGLVDPNGVLWSAADNNNYLVRIDVSKPNGHPDLIRIIPLNATSYGMGIDPDGNIWNSNWVYNTVKKINPAGAILGTFASGGSNIRGVAVTAEGDVWVANSGSASVSRLRNNGSLVAVIGVGQEPTGVAIDAAGKVWASNLGSSTASRIDPATNTVDLTVSLGAGANPYNYSDMTGSTLTGAPDNGTWSVVYDSGAADTAWAFLDWAAQVAGDGSVTVTVASSADGVTFGPDVAVIAGEDITGLANGRYLRVTARFARSTAGDSPVLFDLTIAHAGDRANNLAYKWRLVDIDGPPVFLSSTTSATPSFVAPDDGTYTFELTVTDSAGLSDTDEVRVDVSNLNPAVSAHIGSAFARSATLVSASFTDPGWLDTHHATFNWGDGTPVQAIAVTAQGTGWGSFFGSHVYSAAGSYHVVVTLIDDDGGSATVDLGQVSVSEPVAVWANSSTVAKTFEWAGSGGTITGRVHSNREVKIAGTLPKSIIGPTEYVTSITVSGPHNVTPVQSTVQPYPVTYNISNYAPGGPVAIQVGAAYFNHTANCSGGLWDVGSQVLPVGVHYAPCSIKINGSSIGGRITLVATGTIDFSGSRPAFEPYYDGLLLLAGSSAKKAINISASSSKFLGVIYAGAGEVSLSGSNSKFFCGIYGNTVSMSGSNLTLRGGSCGRPDSTISGPLLVPDLQLSLEADPDESLPGGDIAYDLRVSNSGSLLIVPGLLGLENVDTSPATVTGITYALEYFSIPTGTWIPIATLANGTVTLDAHANPAPGVTYPAPNQIVGTQVGPGGFATWGYQALVELTPAQVNLLLNPSLVGGFRNRVDFTLNPTTVQVRRLFTFGTDFIAALRALSGNITDPSVTFLPPSGDLVTLNGTTNPALAILSPGETVAAEEAFTVPVPAARSALETDAGYLARLLTLDGSPLVGSSFALATGGVGRLVAPLVSATTTERLPVVSIATSGPDSMPAGTIAQYNLALANQGSAAAPDLAVSAKAAGIPTLVSGAPSSLAAGELATATTTYTAPADDPPADVTIAGAVTWSDANGNDYGPVGSTRTTEILTAATLSAILVDTLQADVGADGQVSPGDTVRYSVTISNHGGQPLTNVVASITPDANSALVVGSVSAPGGSVTTGNAAGDTAVVVSYASIAGGSNVTFTFDVTVDDPFPAGASHLEVAGQVTADGFSPVPTDDPSLLGQANPTRTSVVVPVPNLLASLEGHLLLDPDGNGFPSAGDTLRYELTVASVGSQPVTGISVGVPTPNGTSVVAGSVTTSTGTVNGGPDVSVTVGSLPFLSAATIRFDLRIANPVPAGLNAITAQGTVASNELADLVTDDPHTVAANDATVITIGAGSGGGGGGTPGVPGPAIGAVTPGEGTVITEPVDIAATLTPPAGETVTAWTVCYHLDGDTTLTQLASGTGTTVVATIDPTVLPNGAYVIVVRAEGSAGGVTIAETSIVVDGKLKLGRFQITYQDLSVPVGGIPLRVLRTYDSFDKSVGDFGVGWRLELANFRAATNGPLGQGGWTMFGCGPGFIFVPLCFESTRPHYVSVTWPDGRTEIFDLTPAKGSTFLSGLTSARFTGRPGTTSTLEAVDSSLYFSNGDLLGGFFGSSGIYDPSQFRLTDKVGTVYLLDTELGLMSATDRNGNTVTIDSAGIHSSLGPSITFTRDASGRITKIRAPDDSEIRYTINAQSDLARVTYADGALIDYTYEAGHALDTIVDADGHALRTLEYDADGRLSALIDGEGNRTEITTDPDTRQQVVTDPAGDLSTVSTFDDRGNLIHRDEISGGVTHTTEFAYDENDQPILRRDPLGHEWTADYDGSDLVEFVDASGETVEIVYNGSGLPTSWTDPAGNVTTYAYDAADNLTQERNALGKLETFTYDGNGNRLTRTNAEDGTWTWTYDAAGHRISQEDPAGRETTWTYDELGNKASQTDDDGHTTSWTYGPVGNLLTETDAAGRTTTWTYDDQHHVASRTEPGSATTSWDYDLTGNVTRTTDPTGRTTDYVYDENSRRISEEAGDGGIALFGYDGFGRLASTTDPLGREVENTYDVVGRLLTSTNQAGGVTTYTYDAEGKLLTETNPTGDTTTYGYDLLGRRTSVTDPLGNMTTMAFDPFGRPLGTIYADGTETTQEYDDAGRLVRSVDQDGGITEYGYDPAGRLTSLTDPLDHTTAYQYDAAGRITATTDPLGRVTSMEYDAEGRLIERTTGAGVTTTFEYNDRGQPTAAIDELGNTARTEYDLAGRITREIDPRGKPTVYEYEAAGRLALIRDALGATVEFDYNLAGERTSITDARGKTWSTTYGDLGLPVTETDPLGRSRSMAYDVAGREIEREDARGIVVSLAYDDAGRLTSVSGAGQAITYGYDDVGRRTQTVDATGTTAWTYDGTGDITGVTRPAGSVAYTYDLAGQRTSMTQPQGTVDYTYDGAGWPATLVDWNDQAYDFDYDADGRLLSIQRPGGGHSNYTYDAAGRTSTITHAAGATTLESFSHTYDASGNRIAASSDAGPETYTYSDRNQLLSASYPGGTSVAFTYDPAGNRLTRTTGAGTTAYAYDDAGQLTNAGGTAYAYDAAGNRVQAGANSFSWDWLGRLAGANVGGVSSTYASDGDNLRTSATVGGQTTNYTWDRTSRIERVVSDGSAGYLHDRDGLLAEVRPSGTTQALRDALGSVRGRASGTTQTGDVDYDVFGAVRASSGVSGAFGFAGELQDPSGLVYLRARSMDPATGAFLSIDPIRPGGPGVVGYGLYSYVGGNPVSMIDPTGEQAILERVTLGQLAIIVVGSLLLWWYFQTPAWRDLANCLASACFASSGTAASSSTTTTIDDVIPRIRFKTPDLDKGREIAETLAKACLASIGAAMLVGLIDSPCAGGIDVFLPGNHVVGPLAGKVSETTQHSFDAIGGGWTAAPHKGINGSADGWYNAVPPCLGRPLGSSCDEYPYMSTQEGGFGASLRVVDPRYQSKQGGDLGAFYNPFGCNVQVGTQFLVVPVPVPFIPTAKICSP